MTEPMRYNGATTARNNIVKISSTTATVITMMNLMSWL